MHKSGLVLVIAVILGILGCGPAVVESVCRRGGGGGGDDGLEKNPFSKNDWTIGNSFAKDPFSEGGRLFRFVFCLWSMNLFHDVGLQMAVAVAAAAVSGLGAEG
jgi:hypothetical protein